MSSRVGRRYPNPPLEVLEEVRFLSHTFPPRRTFVPAAAILLLLLSRVFSYYTAY